MQFTSVDPDAPPTFELAERFELPEDVAEQTPFVLFGPIEQDVSVEQDVDEIQRLCGRLGVSHFVIGDPDGVEPVVGALARA